MFYLVSISLNRNLIDSSISFLMKMLILYKYVIIIIIIKHCELVKDSFTYHGDQ